MKPKLVQIISLCLFITLFTLFCGPKKPITDHGLWDGERTCEIERLNWVEVREGYDSETVSKLASALEAAAKADSEKIKLLSEASVGLKVNFDLNKVIKLNTYRGAKVSQDFFEKATAYRFRVCTLLLLIKEGRITPQRLDVAQKAITDLKLDFGELKQKYGKNDQE